MVLPLGGSNKDPGTPVLLFGFTGNFPVQTVGITALYFDRYNLLLSGTLRGALRVEGDGSRREYLGAGRSSIDARSRPVSLARSRLGRQNRYRNPE
ncbi:uncharacterized protein ACIBXB_021584 isoform 2-T2 [Morphnus guianensis]